MFELQVLNTNNGSHKLILHCGYDSQVKKIAKYYTSCIIGLNDMGELRLANTNKPNCTILLLDNVANFVVDGLTIYAQLKRSNALRVLAPWGPAPELPNIQLALNL